MFWEIFKYLKFIVYKLKCIKLYFVGEWFGDKEDRSCNMWVDG